MSKFIGTRLTLPNLATAPSSPGAGDAYYDTVANTAYVHNGTSWVDLAASGGGSGDITDVVAGAGLTGGATSGSATLTVGAGTGITVNADDVAINTATVPLKSDNLGAFATSTSAAIGVGTIELGHATDTTLARSAAGIVAVEGVTVVRLYSAALTGTGTSFTVTHGLGAVWVTVMVYDTTTGKYLIPDHTINLSSGTPTGTVTITFPASVTGSNYRVVITG